MSAEDLTKRLVIQFEGDEIGADTLNPSLYSKLFNSVVNSSVELENSLLQPLCSENNLFTVDIDQEESNEMESKLMYYGSLGKILIKMIYDQRTIPIRLAPYLMRYLTCNDKQTERFEQMLTVSDVEMMSPLLGRNLRLRLSMDVSSDTDDKESKKEYVDKILAKELYTDRKNNMKAMRRGFRCMIDLIPSINMLNETDLALLISEQHFVDRRLLIDECLHFVSDTDGSDIRLCRQVLRSMSDEQLQMFLFFATGQVGLFHKGCPGQPLWNPNDLSPYPRNRITLKVYHTSLYDVRCVALFLGPGSKTHETIKTAINGIHDCYMEPLASSIYLLSHQTKSLRTLWPLNRYHTGRHLPLEPSTKKLFGDFLVVVVVVEEDLSLCRGSGWATVACGIYRGSDCDGL